MKINSITLSDLRRMNGKEGLILQGCGGEIKEWMDGINKMLTDKGILLDNTKFENVSVFQNDGVTCILYPFEEVHLDIGKLAMWRLQSYTAFAGTWLSDYVENKLGGFITDEQIKAEKLKFDCALIGQDGNIFNLLGIASHTLKQNGMADEAKEMCSRVTSSESYCEALNIIDTLEPMIRNFNITNMQLKEISLKIKGSISPNRLNILPSCNIRNNVLAPCKCSKR